MKKNSKIAVVAGLGAIAGGVAGYYLNSDKGREQRLKAEEAIKEKSAQASSYVGDLANKAKSTATDLASKAQHAMASTSNKVGEMKDRVADGAQKAGERTQKTGSNGGYSNVNS